MCNIVHYTAPSPSWPSEILLNISLALLQRKWGLRLQVGGMYWRPGTKMENDFSLFFKIQMTVLLKAVVVSCLEVLKIPVVTGWVARAQHFWMSGQACLHWPPLFNHLQMIPQFIVTKASALSQRFSISGIMNWYKAKSKDSELVCSKHKHMFSVGL